MNVQSGIGTGLYFLNHKLDYDPIGTDTAPFMRVGIGYSIR